MADETEAVSAEVVPAAEAAPSKLERALAAYDRLAATPQIPYAEVKRASARQAAALARDWS